MVIRRTKASILMVAMLAVACNDGETTPITLENQLKGTWFETDHTKWEFGDSSVTWEGFEHPVIYDEASVQIGGMIYKITLKKEDTLTLSSPQNEPIVLMKHERND